MSMAIPMVMVQLLKAQDPNGNEKNAIALLQDFMAISIADSDSLNASELLIDLLIGHNWSWLLQNGNFCLYAREKNKPRPAFQNNLTASAMFRKVRWFLKL